MSKIFRNVKNIFKKAPSSRQSSSATHVDRDLQEGTRDYVDEDSDENSDNLKSTTYAYVTQQTTRSSTSEKTPLYRDLSTSSNCNNSEDTSVSRGVQPDSPHNTDINTNSNSSSNTDTDPTKRGQTLPLQNDTQNLPSHSPSIQALPNDSPAKNDPKQSLPSSTKHIPQPSVRDNLAPDINQSRKSFVINPNSALVDFNSDQDQRVNRQLLHPSFRLGRSFLPRKYNQSSFMPLSTRFRSQNHGSKFEFDYPIENVFINEAIPPSTAIKINGAVEHDRFGNAYHTHRYTYAPQTQNITIGNKTQSQRHLIEDSRHNGIRYVREINNQNFYPQKAYDEIRQMENLNNLPVIIDNMPRINYQLLCFQDNLGSFSMPINYFTALALPNDLMRIQ